MGTALDQLEKLRKAADWLRTCPDPDVVHVGEGMASWLEQSGPSPFAVRTRGGISLERRNLIGERDALVRAVARRCWPSFDPVAQSKVLAVRFARYQADRWPRDRLAADAPASEPEGTFWRLLRAETPLPKSKQLLRILRNSGHAKGALDVPGHQPHSPSKGMQR